MYSDHPFDRIRLRHLFFYWICGSVLLGFFAALFGFGEGSSGYAMDIILVLGELSWMMAFMVIFARKARLHWPSFLGRLPDAQDFKDMAKLAIFMVLLAYVDIYLIFVALSYPLPAFVEWWMVTDESLFYSDDQGQPLFFANLFTPIYMVILAPIVEELFFRGFLLHRLCRKYGLNRAVLISSIFFGLLHASVFSAFAFGVAMSVVYIRTGSLGLTMLCHGFNNLIAWGIALAYAIVEDSSDPYEYSLAAYRSEWYLGAIAAIAAAWMAVRFVQKPLHEVAWELPDVSND